MNRSMPRDEAHPDDLVARARHRDLPHADAAMLADHVDVCSLCAFEIAVGADFAADLAAPVPAEIPLPTPPRARRRDPRSTALRVGLLAAAVASVALAAWGLRGRGAHHNPALMHPAPTSRAAPVAIRAAPAPSIAVPTMPDPAVIPLPTTTRAEAVSTPPRVAHARPAQSVAPPARLDEDPAALLARAREARQRDDLVGARTVYEQLQQRYPDSAEAAISHVALGRLLLDRLGDPAHAVSQFDAYVADDPHGDLREEALVGRALAFGALHRDDDERRAWNDLLRAFPTTLSAVRARARLEALR